MQNIITINQPLIMAYKEATEKAGLKLSLLDCIVLSEIYTLSQSENAANYAISAKWLTNALPFLNVSIKQIRRCILVLVTCNVLTYSHTTKANEKIYKISNSFLET